MRRSPRGRARNRAEALARRRGNILRDRCQQRRAGIGVELSVAPELIVPDAIFLVASGAPFAFAAVVLGAAPKAPSGIAPAHYQEQDHQYAEAVHTRPSGTPLRMSS